MKYLDLSLGGHAKSCSFWDPVMEMVHKKFACWRKFYISLGGKLTLIKAAMPNIQVYYTYLFKMPGKII